MDWGGGGQGHRYQNLNQYEDQYDGYHGNSDDGWVYTLYGNGYWQLFIIPSCPLLYLYSTFVFVLRADIVLVSE